LTQREDCGEWCLPGGAAEIAESPSEAACREALEETGLEIRAEALIGVYDNRLLPGHHSQHAYHLVFACRRISGIPRITEETIGFAWCDEAEAAQLKLYRGHVTKVPAAFSWARRRNSAYFD
jgi:ADP-ribose pyrophosphatase YjhB (NUDIX family)